MVAVVVVVADEEGGIGGREGGGGGGGRGRWLKERWKGRGFRGESRGTVAVAADRLRVEKIATRRGLTSNPFIDCTSLLPFIPSPYTTLSPNPFHDARARQKQPSTNAR